MESVSSMGNTYLIIVPIKIATSIRDVMEDPRYNFSRADDRRVRFVHLNTPRSKRQHYLIRDLWSTSSECSP